MPDPVRLRLVETWEELQDCVAFQQSIWGAEFADIVPASILWVAAKTGGVVAGAYDASDRLAGFLFGLTGWEDGRPLHWSDMLAVRPDMRGQGIGFRLKQLQRETLLGRGVTRCVWTADPLEAGNAHLNLNRLGATSRTYIRDCYGTSASPLHSGLPTDRLRLEWQLDAPRVRTRMETRHADPPAGAATAAVINPGGAEPHLDLTGEYLRLEVPANIQRLKREHPDTALAWRIRTRMAFETYFARGYEAMGITASPGGASYVLSPASS